MAAHAIVAAVVAGEQWLHHMNSGSRHSSSRQAWGKTYGWQVASAVLSSMYCLW